MAAAVARALKSALRWLMGRDERHREEWAVGLEAPEISDAVHEEADDELRDWN